MPRRFRFLVLGVRCAATIMLDNPRALVGGAFHVAVRMFTLAGYEAPTRPNGRVGHRGAKHTRDSFELHQCPLPACPSSSPGAHAQFGSRDPQEPEATWRRFATGRTPHGGPESSTQLEVRTSACSNRRRPPGLSTLSIDRARDGSASRTVSDTRHR